MVKTRSRPLSSVFYNKSKDNALDENGVPAQMTLKAVEQGKRSAEGSPDNVPSRKRAAFGDITNATFNQLGGEKGGKKKQAKSGVGRKQTQQQGKAKTAGKAKPKQRKSKEITQPSVCDHEEQTKAVSPSPSGAILSSQDSMEESTSSQDSLQISSCNSDADKSNNDNSKEQQQKEEVGNAEKSTEDEVIDIDADTSDPVTVSEYANEIFVNMKRRETLFPLTNYMETQKDITPQMRAILVDWLVEVQECFELYHETLYLGVKLLDHFLERNTIKRDELQLVGATTLLISSKIEERHPPCLDDFIYICDDAYQQQQFIAMESRIIRSLGFDINVPIPYRFLRRYAKAAFANIETLTLARFLLESSLLESRFVANRASFMAASCLRLAMMMNSFSEWTPTLVHFTGYTSNELRDCVLQLNLMNSAPANKNLMTVKNKYSHKVFHEVAKIPALDTLTIEI